MNQALNKWSSSILNISSGQTDCSNQFDNIGNINSTTGSTDFSSFAFPLVKRIFGGTVVSGGWRKSKKQQLKETRINKLRKIKGKKPNVTLPDDEFVDGLVSVQPLSSPIGLQLFYTDYVYQSSSVRKNRKTKLEKLNNSIRINKIKYIEEMLQKIIEENG